MILHIKNILLIIFSLILLSSLKCISYGEYFSATKMDTINNTRLYLYSPYSSFLILNENCCSIYTNDIYRGKLCPGGYLSFETTNPYLIIEIKRPFSTLLKYKIPCNNNIIYLRGSFSFIDERVFLKRIENTIAQEEIKDCRIVY